MKRRNHVIHKYKQVKWGAKGTVVYKCMLADCTHYMHKEMVKGQRAICWECGASTVMTDENLRRVKPKCFGSCRGEVSTPMESPMPTMPSKVDLSTIKVKSDLSDLSDKLVELVGSKS